MANLVVFEDSKYVNFYPLTKTRPVYSLKCGVYSLVDKFYNRFKNEFQIYLHQRDILNKVLELKNDYKLYKNGDISSFTAVNCRIIVDDSIEKIIRKLSEDKIDKIYIDDAGNFLAGYFSASKVFEKTVTNSNNEGEILKGTFKIADYIWDLVFFNEKEIKNDLKYIKNDLDLVELNKFRAVNFVNRENIFIDSSVVIKPGVVIDASDGPVILDKCVKIFPNSVIIGSVYIGKKSIIKAGAKIYEGVSIGEVCKVGGEVEESIFIGYSNKQHDGFLGHSYVGSWCNFGADTNNSDLKNNYSNVKVELNGNLVDTKSQFAGLFIGDHSKTGINTMLNTGTVIGVGCSVFGSGFPKRNIPDFHWSSDGKLIRYFFKKTVATEKIVMSRRNKELTADYEDVLKNIYENLL